MVNGSDYTTFRLLTALLLETASCYVDCNKRLAYCDLSGNYQADLVSGLLGLKTLVVKMCSVTLSMAGGIIAGKEGPFIHAGGIVGGGWASMGSR